MLYLFTDSLQKLKLEKIHDNSGFDLSFGSATVKIYHFTTLYCVNEDHNVRTIYFPPLLKIKFLLENIVSQAQLALFARIQQ